MKSVIITDKIKEIFGKPDVGKKFIHELLSIGHVKTEEKKADGADAEETLKEESDGSYTVKVDGHKFNVINVSLLDKSNAR